MCECVCEERLSHRPFCGIYSWSVCNCLLIYILPNKEGSALTPGNAAEAWALFLLTVAECSLPQSVLIACLLAQIHTHSV